MMISINIMINLVRLVATSLGSINAPVVTNVEVINSCTDVNKYQLAKTAHVNNSLISVGDVA